MRSLYLDLLKSCLTDQLYVHPCPVPIKPRNLWKRMIVGMLAARDMSVVRFESVDEQLRREGRDWPSHAHTMIGNTRLDHLQFCIQDVIERGIPGDLIEAGVWRGGASIFMRAVLKAYDITDRYVWVADSFAGLPPPNPTKYPSDAGDPHHTIRELCVPIEIVMSNFDRYNLLDDQVLFLKGWFRDTLSSDLIGTLAVVRLDGDMYESTMDALVGLYPKLSPGGYLIVDDYGAVPACRQAVEDYRRAHGIVDHIQTIDWTGVYWTRS
ncbi:MAG: class I SAM-dependent methyltransferase [Acidobacteria bacterium]|nr:class I SAM-dependent methyltransferase [Acidobacteriota bacterium]